MISCPAAYNTSSYHNTIPSLVSHTVNIINPTPVSHTVNIINPRPVSHTVNIINPTPGWPYCKYNKATRSPENSRQQVFLHPPPPPIRNLFLFFFGNSIELEKIRWNEKKNIGHPPPPPTPQTCNEKVLFFYKKKLDTPHPPPPPPTPTLGIQNQKNSIKCKKNITPPGVALTIRHIANGETVLLVAKDIRGHCATVAKRFSERTNRTHPPCSPHVFSFCPLLSCGGEQTFSNQALWRECLNKRPLGLTAPLSNCLCYTNDV